MNWREIFGLKPRDPTPDTDFHVFWPGQTLDDAVAANPRMSNEVGHILGIMHHYSAAEMRRHKLRPLSVFSIDAWHTDPLEMPECWAKPGDVADAAKRMAALIEAGNVDMKKVILRGGTGATDPAQVVEELERLAAAALYAADKGAELVTFDMGTDRGWAFLQDKPVNYFEMQRKVRGA